MTTSTGNKWPVATREHPCPRCGKPNRCKIAPDGKAGHCWRSGGTWNESKGHRSVDVWPPRGSTLAAPERVKLASVEVELLDRHCRTAITSTRLTSLAQKLRLSVTTLRAFGIGWHADLSAFTFAMRDGDGHPVGVRTRLSTGEKRAVAGSRTGIFIPDATANVIVPDTLLVAEGPTDAAAAVDLGFAAIGRPDCNNGEEAVLRYVQRIGASNVVIIADADAPGQAGAHKLALRLAEARRRANVLTLPGAKDLRAWKALPDGTHHDLAALIDAPANRRIA